ncbi:MAG: hypothetical protein K1000chlam2_00334 [Chlamydiae bacterium]|nr:hypothetical protein [Chlamydiota bacterium]
MEIRPTSPSRELKESVAHTTAAAAGTYINREGREVKATLGPVDQSAAQREQAVFSKSLPEKS